MQFAGVIKQLLMDLAEKLNKWMEMFFIKSDRKSNSMTRILRRV